MVSHSCDAGRNGPPVASEFLGMLTATGPHHQPIKAADPARAPQSAPANGEPWERTSLPE